MKEQVNDTLLFYMGNSRFSSKLSKLLKNLWLLFEIQWYNTLYDFGCKNLKNYFFVFFFFCEKDKSKLCMHYSSFLEVVWAASGIICAMFTGKLRRWYNPLWYSEKIPSTPYDPMLLREAFEKACSGLVLV